MGITVIENSKLKGRVQVVRTLVLVGVRRGERPEKVNRSWARDRPDFHARV